MTAEVRRLDGAKIEPEEAGGNPEVIAQLEWMLERAKRGQLEAFAAVMREADGLGTATRGTWRGGFFEAIGALAILQIDMSNGSREGGDARHGAGA